MSTHKPNKRPLYISYSGPALLETPLLNKGIAFTQEERKTFNLEGLLPYAHENIEEQAKRAYQQFSSFQNNLNKHIYLRNIQDTNETLYYRLIIDHLQEMLPIIYTPTVGEACQLFSQIYRRKRGLFISYPNRERIEEILNNATKKNIKVLVVTDSERILGLGDQGIGGMGIPIGKLALYSACGGISPAYTLPVTLDVGTNNEQLLNDPMYMGWRHERIHGDAYFGFIEQFINAIKRQWPKALVQFEDFAQGTAMPILKQYQHELCCFNDDIQGTAAITVATLLAACRVQNIALKDQRIVFIGAGSAGCGIAEQICAHMRQQGLTSDQALDKIYLHGLQGLLDQRDTDLLPFQQKFAKNITQMAMFSGLADSPSLLELIQIVKPTILVGVSGQAGLMTQQIISSLYQHCRQPIILPLSNPTSCVEAHPKDILQWTNGQAMVATGSPFNSVSYKGENFPIAQCNNSYIFPGIGLGAIASGATRISDSMFMVASETLATCSPLARGEGADLLPPLNFIRPVSKAIALAVARQAVQEGVCELLDPEGISAAIEKNFWEPEYREYRRTSF